jgi:hypothetical protein
VTTLRIARRRQFVRLDSRAVNDPKLSYRALGVLTWLLEKPDNWTVRSENIAAAKKEGRDAIRTALRELEAAGYLVRNKYRDQAGVWRSEAVIYESAQDATQEADHDGKPALVTRGGLPDAGFSGSVVTNQTHDSNQPGTKSSSTDARRDEPDDDDLIAAAARAHAEQRLASRSAAEANGKTFDELGDVALWLDRVAAKWLKRHADDIALIRQGWPEATAEQLVELVAEYALPAARIPAAAATPSARPVCVDCAGGWLLDADGDVIEPPAPCPTCRPLSAGNLPQGATA